MSDPAKDHSKYLGMSIFQALAYAAASGEQLRVITNHGKAMRYVDEPHESHICVHVQSGFITKTS